VSAPAEQTASPDLFGAIDEAWRAELRAGRWAPRTTARDYLYLSGIRDCARRMALDLLHPEEDEEFSDDALDRMERGKEREETILARLARVGRRCAVPFEVVETQLKLDLRDRDGTLLARGKIDARLKFKEPSRASLVTEIKSGRMAERIETLEDMDRSQWTTHWIDQLGMYLLQTGEPSGLFLMDRPGTPRFIPLHVEDHMSRLEGVIQAMRSAVDARFDRAPLPAYTTDPSLCRACPHFGKSCAPDVDYGAGAQIFGDAEIAAAEERERTRDCHVAYERADEFLKKRLRGVELALIGPFVATGKWGAQTSYEIPDEVKALYKRVNEQGRWTMKIERIPG
jgi:hypothetical protein